MLKKVLAGIALTIVVLVLGLMLFLRFNGDPNYLFKKIAVPVKEGETEELSVRYNSRLPLTERTALYEFTPSENAEYDFTLSDISCDEDVTLRMTVMDESFSEYASASSADADEATEDPGTVSCRVSLQKRSTCYIGIDAESSENRDRFVWKCSFNVSKAPEEEKPEEITLDKTVSLKLKPDEKKGLLFIPDETGYYKFDAEITSGSSSGYAEVDSVTFDDNKGAEVTDGLCMLTEGTEYYVWISAFDIRKSCEAEVSCRKIGTCSFDGAAEVSLDGESVIEYTADEAGTFAIYSVSEGDPDVCIYDSDGFPLRNDTNSGAEISGNEHDFAAVIDAAAGDTYRIFVSGKIKDCKVIRARYTGDGTSLGPDDIEKIEITREAAPGDAAADADANRNVTGSEEQQ